MGWLLLAAAAVAFFVIKTRSSMQAVQNEDGTWGFRATALGIVNNDAGPFASSEAALAAAAAWVASVTTNVNKPLPDPIDVPPPGGPQGGGAPNVPYLIVTSQGIQGSAVVEGSSVRWVAGTESDTAGSAITANATLLARIDSGAPANAPVNLSLRKASGSSLQARVSRQVGQPAQVWVWSVSTPPAVAGGVGSSTTEPTWRANNRLGAMRGALSTLQDA